MKWANALDKVLLNSITGGEDVVVEGHVGSVPGGGFSTKGGANLGPATMKW